MSQSPTTPDPHAQEIAPPPVDDHHRAVDLERIGVHRYKATNARGGVVAIGGGDDPDFTPVELLLAALAGCGALDVEHITEKRASSTSFRVRAEGDKVRDEGGNHLTGLRISFDVEFPDGEAGDAARSVLERAIRQSRDRLCTVGRTMQLGAAVDYATPGGVLD